MPNPDLAAIRARVAAATAEVDRLCASTPWDRWRMSIPVTPDRDSDVILSASLADIPALLALVEQQEVLIGAERTRAVMASAGWAKMNELNDQQSAEIARLRDALDWMVRDHDARDDSLTLFKRSAGEMDSRRHAERCACPAASNARALLAPPEAGRDGRGGAVMGKYRKKPVVIDALRWDGTNVDEMLAFVLTHASLSRGPGAGSVTDLLIETAEGVMRASVGDWIIKGVAGEYYPCKPAIFAQTYEAVAP